MASWLTLGLCTESAPGPSAGRLPHPCSLHRTGCRPSHARRPGRCGWLAHPSHSPRWQSPGSQHACLVRQLAAQCRMPTDITDALPEQHSWPPCSPCKASGRERGRWGQAKAGDMHPMCSGLPAEACRLDSPPCTAEL